MATIDYKKVECPKCGKSYFRVKENSGVSFTTLVFTTKPDPIYKDGELQNPLRLAHIRLKDLRQTERIERVLSSL